MVTNSFLSAVSALLTMVTSLPPVAVARAESGTKVENVELQTLGGGREKLLSPKAKANVFVFFRPNQERSLDALKQMAACEKELAGKSVHWAAVVSSSETPEDIQAYVTESGIKMPVLLDEGDQLYARLEVRLHPMVGIADSKGVLQSLEPYRQINYCEMVKTRIRILLGEATVAQLDKVVNPDSSPLPGSDPMKKAMRDVNMARRLFEIGQFEKSVEFAQRALLIAPVAHAFTVMGNSYARLGRCEDARKAFDQARKLDPKEADVITVADCR